VSRISHSSWGDTRGSRCPILLYGVLWLTCLLSSGVGHAAPTSVIQDVHLRSDHRTTRVIIEVDSVVLYEIGRLTQPHSLFVHLPQTRLARDWERHSIQVHDGRLHAIRVTQHQTEHVRIILDLQADGDYFIYTLRNPYRIVVDLRQGKVASEALRQSPRTQPSSLAAVPSAPVRPLTIVIDPGHGGKDPGAIGPGGLMEKTVVLQIAKELRQIIRATLPHVRVILTRETDRFIPLKRRAEVANQHEAQLFISIHANSSPRRDASGIETWYLSFAANAQAKQIAARENQMQETQLSALEIILRDLQQTDRINQSAVLASMAQTSLARHMAEQYDGIIDRGVDGAPFVVLLHTAMPSILVEVSFVSNPRDEKRLGNQTYQRTLAQGIFRGLHRYLQTIVVAVQ
jgi:N-acetylmuramoyl-L-alanine amidase